MIKTTIALGLTITDDLFREHLRNDQYTLAKRDSPTREALAHQIAHVLMQEEKAKEQTELLLNPFVLKDENPLRYKIQTLISSNESTINKILIENPHLATENDDSFACGRMNTLVLENRKLKEMIYED